MDAEPRLEAALVLEEQLRRPACLTARAENHIVGRPDLAELQVLGVKRVSVGSGLSSAALGGFMRAAREMREHGTFTFVRAGASRRELQTAFKA